jgi:O-antigen ligase
VRSDAGINAFSRSVGPQTDRPGRRTSEAILYSSLLALLWIPPQVVLWGRVELVAGDERGAALAFTVYREPKLAVLQILGWSFLALFILVHRHRLASRAARERWVALLRHPFFVTFAATLLWGGLTVFWVRVPENLLYELVQLVFLYVFTLTLALWSSWNPRVSRRLLFALALAPAPSVLLSGIQLMADIPILQPIDPGHGVRHGALFGAKNPMALALLGSFFLLLAVTFHSDGAARDARTAKPARLGRPFWESGPGRILGVLYAVAVFALLVSLQSRTALFALLSTSLLLLLALWLRAGRGSEPEARRSRLWLLAPPAIGLTLLGVCCAWSPGVAGRAESLLDLVSHPSTYLASDRGVYFLNTLDMVRDHPLGVGLGDWQTHYPLHRRVGRNVAFTAAHQTRRAHNDHVQVLGETGWPGLVLWLAFLAVALGVPLRHAMGGEGSARCRWLSLFVAAQLLALMTAMGTDYLVERPWHKLQFFVTAVLAWTLARGESAKPESRHEDAGDPSPRAARAVVAVAILTALLAVGAGVYFSQHLLRSRLSAQLAARYEGALGSDDMRRWLAVARTGEHHGRLAGHTRTAFRDDLIRAHAALALGDRERALELCQQSLRLHPHHPNTYLLLAEIVAPVDPGAGERYRRIHDQILAGTVKDLVFPDPGRLDVPRLVIPTESKSHDAHSSAIWKTWFR